MEQDGGLSDAEKVKQATRALRKLNVTILTTLGLALLNE
jgi:hypothetical protein